MSNSNYLLDSSVLIALLVRDHFDHSLVVRWLEDRATSVAVCPITQGAFLRVYMQRAVQPSVQEALQVLTILSDAPDARFIPDDADYVNLDPRGVRGHRQVTDAYLALLALKHGLRLATLDQAQAALHPLVAELVSD